MTDGRSMSSVSAGSLTESEDMSNNIYLIINYSGYYWSDAHYIKC
jgi:hypothetical protein